MRIVQVGSEDRNHSLHYHPLLLCLNSKEMLEVHTEARRKVLQDSGLPISFNYVDIHGKASGNFSSLDCFAEPMPNSGPCSFPSLDETDIIHVLGGNTFYLQEMISTHDIT